jgi:hypothetical protein
MPLPTNEQLAGMSREQLLSLWALVRQFRIKLMGLGPMPESAIEDMSKIVDDKLMRDIVADNFKAKGVPSPSGLIRDERRAEPQVRGSGWQSPAKVEDRSRHFGCSMTWWRIWLAGLTNLLNKMMG